MNDQSTLAELWRIIHENEDKESCRMVIDEFVCEILEDIGLDKTAKVLREQHGKMVQLNG